MTQSTDSDTLNTDERRPPDARFVIENGPDIQDSPGEGAVPPLRTTWLADGDSLLCRLPSNKLISADVHPFLPTEGAKVTYHCNGQGCAACLAHYRSVLTTFLPVLDLGSLEIAVMTFSRTAGVGSMAGQIVPIIQRVDACDLILEISKARRRFLIRIVKKIDEGVDGPEFGLDVIKDTAGLMTPDNILGTVERRSNQEMLFDVPDIGRKLALLAPSVDVGAL